ncbi:thioredoxin family protein [Zunongwangia endophytica]|uniref:Thioredoxin family protein n=1 Tax=Zunongwangia endophytica TaxID=1808945 RepID=A0ABV8H3E5_9FLAO|nr:thioredoxin family protein [Zunongwangia endophytica]MDN3596136.1 thioredoxin family protein [Zunongwangia endophytica]
MTVNKPVFSYIEFYEWTLQLVNNKQTSGDKQTESLVKFTELNASRMKRLNKTTKLIPELENLVTELKKKQVWYVITEAWCGDSAQNLPVIGEIASAGDKIDLRVILRDKNPELIEKYHTNGSKSIPKLVAFSEEGVELFTWGPRPEPAQELVMDWKENPNGRDFEDFERELHTWYAKDKTHTVQKEFLDILNSLKY